MPLKREPVSCPGVLSYSERRCVAPCVKPEFPCLVLYLFVLELSEIVCSAHGEMICSHTAFARPHHTKDFRHGDVGPFVRLRMSPCFHRIASAGLTCVIVPFRL